MSGNGYPLEPREVPRVNTRHRRIVTAIPVPESIPILERLRQFEPQSLSGQPLVVWDRAEGIQIHDRWGNTWLDWTSGVLVTNAGHCHPKIKQAVLDQVNHGLLHNYCFPSELRAELVAELARVAPERTQKVFLLSTGSETTECAIKLARTHGIKIGGTNKIGIITFQNAFHGRTLGAQMAGGIPDAKEWIVNLDPDMVQVPFPDGYRYKDTSFDAFLWSLEEKNYKPDRVAAVMTETFLGGNASFAPAKYMQQLRTWCDQHNVLLIFDEIQAGFGRTGKYWGFEHYGITPDLICCGKGITSGLPLSAIIGPASVMDLYPPGSMTSTHTGNPVCVASALANLQAIEQDGLVDNARTIGQTLQTELRRIGQRFADYIGAVHGKGLVASLHIVKPGGAEPDPDRATDIVRRCIEKGLMLFSPVGYEGASVKICPPLCINEAALREGIEVLNEGIEESIDELAVQEAAQDR